MADFGLSEIALVGAVASAATAAAGAIAAGNAQKTAMAYNAQQQQQASTQAQQASDAQALATERQGQLRQGQEAAAVAGAGVEGGGSALDVMSDDASQAKLNALSVKYNGTIAANRDLAQSNVDIFEGNQAQTAGYIGAGSTLLSAGSKFADGLSKLPSSPSGGYGATNQMSANGVGAQTSNGFAVGPV